MIEPLLGLAVLVVAVSVQKRWLAGVLFFACGWLVHGAGS